jgi:hypothetical protein
MATRAYEKERTALLFIDPYNEISEIVDAPLYVESAPMVNGESIRIDGDMPAPSGSAAAAHRTVRR